MSNPPPGQAPHHRGSPTKLVAVRLVAVVMALGLAGGLAAMLLLPPPAEPLTAATERVLLVAVAGVAAAEVLTFFVLRPILRNKLAARREAAREELAQGLAPQELAALTIMGAAFAEAVGLLGAIVYYLTRTTWVLVVPAAALAVIVLSMPSRERYGAAIESAGRSSY